MRKALTLLVCAFLGCGDRSGLEVLDAAMPNEDASAIADVITPRDSSADDVMITPKCAPSNCSQSSSGTACCSADNQCITKHSDHACGWGGEACEDCKAGYCVKQTCVDPALNCGPSNCKGCCLQG